MTAPVSRLPDHIIALHDARMLVARADQHSDGLLLEACAILRLHGDAIDHAHADLLEAAIRRARDVHPPLPAVPVLDAHAPAPPLPEPLQVRLLHPTILVGLVLLILLVTAMWPMPATDAVAGGPLPPTVERTNAE